MENQKQIEYKTTSTSALVFNELLAKNLSKRFESSQNVMMERNYNKDADKFLEAPCFNMFEDLPKSEIMNWEKLTRSVINSIESKRQTDPKNQKFIYNSRNSSNSTDIFLEYPSRNDVQTITNLRAPNLKPCFIHASNRSKHNELVDSGLLKNGTCLKKEKTKLIREPDLVKRSKLMNRNNSSSINVNSVKNVSDFKIYKSSFTSKYNIIGNETTLAYPTFVRITKHDRKIQPIASNDADNNIYNTGAVSGKPLIEDSDSVQNGNCNCQSKQLIGSERNKHIRKDEHIPAFLEEKHLINLPDCENEMSNIMTSLFTPVPTEYNMKVRPILENNSARIGRENEISNLKWMEKNVEINLTAPITMNIIKYNSLRRNSNSAVFYSHPTNKKAVVNLEYINSCEFKHAGDEFSILRNTAFQNEKNAYLRASYSMLPKPAERIEYMNKSYEAIELWSYNCPSLESFITKRIRKLRSRITKKELNDHKLKKKAVVSLRRMPEIDQMLKYGIKYSYYPLSINSVSLKSKVKRKTKFELQQYKTIQKISTRKKWYNNYENINVALNRKYPIVLLTRIDISLFENKTWSKKSKQFEMEKYGFNYTLSDKRECLQRNPIVMLTRMDPLMNDELAQKPLNSDTGDIIDLTDT